MKHQTSIRVSKRLYFYFRELQLFQKITINNRSLHLRKLQSAKLFPTSQKITISKQPFKAKTIRKRKGKPKKEKREEERYSIRNGT